jgi:glucokinase
MAGLVDSLLTELRISKNDCAALGVGSPGLIDSAAGVVVFAGNLGWRDVPLAAWLRQRLDLPVSLSNDANCAAWGETQVGAGRGCQHVILLTLGTGIGSGVVVDGRLQEGGVPGGMELGHSLLILDGEPCTCGRRGCLEAYASASALIRQARAAVSAEALPAAEHLLSGQHSLAGRPSDQPAAAGSVAPGSAAPGSPAPASLMLSLCGGDLTRLDGRVPFLAAAQGDAVAQRVIATYIKYLGEGIINCVNIWRPEKILLAGGVAAAGQALLAPLNDYARLRCFAGAKCFVAPIEAAALGNDAGLIGAALLPPDDA